MANADILVDKVAYKGVTIAFCVLAIIGAVARTIIRFRNRQLRVLDDALLLSACICLIAATIMLVKGASYLYMVEALQAHPELAAFASMQEISDAIAKIQQDTYPFGVLIWLSVFAVKFCYLSFFRQLIDRLARITVYWRITLAVTFVACIFNATASFVACPEFGENNLKCTTPYYIRRTTATEATTIALDILSDLMILAIPPYLIYKVSISRRQKIGIAFFLCLSIIMVLIAIIRISQVHTATYNIWATFWQQLEGCVAILMVSLTAFRTLFVSSPQASREKAQKPSDSYRRRLWYKQKGSSEEGKGSGSVERAKVVNVTLPSATLTGMRTFIRGSPRASMAAPDREYRKDPRHDTIHVTHDLDWDSDSVSTELYSKLSIKIRANWE
ncbi:MAG: hypothetical protein Q9218_006168 [Villophora microphyllina]